MAAKASSQAREEKKGELSINEQISGFIQKNRKVFLFGFAALIIILTGFIVTSIVRGNILSNALSQVDGFNRRYEDLQAYIGSSEPEALVKQIELIVLIDEIKKFTEKNSGIAAARAYCINAEIYAGQQMWADAEETWSKAAKEASKTYLAPLSLFNAAVAAEEQGNIDSAIAHYNSALDHGDTFSSAARAQFSIGRLEESRNNKDAALEAYRTLLNRWPNDPIWPNLAQNRILIMSN